MAYASVSSIHSSAFNTSKKTIFVTINGVGMTKDEYKKYLVEKKAKTAKKRRTKKELSDIKVLPSNIKAMLKNAKVINSLCAYYHNGYKQWGVIAKQIINMNEIKTPFTRVCAIANDMKPIMENIRNIAKQDSTDIYQYVRKLSWKLDDMKNEMQDLYKGVNKSKVIVGLSNHECINGEGRRLGLKILMTRTFAALTELDRIVMELERISNEWGKD